MAYMDASISIKINNNCLLTESCKSEKKQTNMKVDYFVVYYSNVINDALCFRWFRLQPKLQRTGRVSEPGTRFYQGYILQATVAGDEWIDTRSESGWRMAPHLD